MLKVSETFNCNEDSLCELKLKQFVADTHMQKKYFFQIESHPHYILKKISLWFEIE